MNPRLSSTPDSRDGFGSTTGGHPSTGGAALAALSPLAARTLLRACAAWDLLPPITQCCLLRRVSSGADGEAAAARAALAALMESAEWEKGRLVQKAALEQLATVTATPAWFAGMSDSGGPH